MSTGYVVTNPNTTYSYATQSGDGGTYNVDSWNPDEYAAGDEYYGVINGRDTASRFGMSIDMDFEGHRIVGGGPGYDNERGYIQIYDWNDYNKSWVSVTQINGPSPGGGSGNRFPWIMTVNVLLWGHRG